VTIDPTLLTPEARAAIGFATEIQMTLDAAIDVDPQHKEIVHQKVLAWLNAAPARKERLNLRYRLDDLEKKRRGIKRAIEASDVAASNCRVIVEETCKRNREEAARMRALAEKKEEEANLAKAAADEDLSIRENERAKHEDMLEETEKLMKELEARYEELGK